MDAGEKGEPVPMKGRTTVERKSGRELVVTRSFNAPARLVFEAWTRPELFRQWWAPKSMGMVLRTCEMDVRVGGGYRLVFGDDASEPMAFFGRYIEVTPHTRLVWTNDEGGDSGPVTTVTLEERGGTTLLVMHELHPSKEALDAAGTGAAVAMGETFEQLDELLVSLGAGRGHPEG
ncbi:MAG: SRPBCC family protein [Caldimonas sp.]